MIRLINLGRRLHLDLETLERKSPLKSFKSFIKSNLLTFKFINKIHSSTIMKFATLFTFAATVIAVAIPPNVVDSIEPLEVRPEPSFSDKFPSGINMNELFENIRNVLIAGRNFEKFRRATKVDVVSYYCSESSNQQRKPVTKTQEAMMKKFQNVLAAAGLDVRDVFCPKHGKRDEFGSQSTHGKNSFFYWVPKEFWDHLKQIQAKAKDH